jgi:hypothetical protein
MTTRCPALGVAVSLDGVIPLSLKKSVNMFYRASAAAAIGLRRCDCGHF